MGHRGECHRIQSPGLPEQITTRVAFYKAEVYPPTVLGEEVSNQEAMRLYFILYVCVCVSMRAHIHVCMFVWRSEVNVQVSYSITLYFPGFYQLPSGSRCSQACVHLTPNSASVVTCLLVPPGKPISFCLYEDSCHQIQSLLGESRTKSPSLCHVYKS